MARPIPRKFNSEQMKIFKEQSAKQTEKTRTPLTVDESLYPMFEIPVNDKRLIYVPDFYEMVTDDETGIKKRELTVDRGAFHSTRHRGSYQEYRCIAQISGLEGFDGTCPFCDSQKEVWDLYNLQYADIASKKNIDPASEEAKEGLKEDRKKLISEMAVSRKVMKVTFPVVVFECKPNTLTMEVDENGVPKARVEWMRCSEKQYTDTWIKAVGGLDEEDQYLGGKFFILDYTYDTKGKEANKMFSAQNLKVVHKPTTEKNREQFNELARYWDEEAKEWTPELSVNTIYNNMVYDTVSLIPVVDEVMTPTRDKLATYELAKGGVANKNLLADNSPEALAANFQATAMESDYGVEEE